MQRSTLRDCNVLRYLQVSPICHADTWIFRRGVARRDLSAEEGHQKAEMEEVWEVWILINGY